MNPRRAFVGAALVVALVSCGSDAPELGPEPAYALYAPELDGAEPGETGVADDRVTTRYERDGTPFFVLTQTSAQAGDLCAVLADERMAGDTCEVRDGVMTTRMEEMSGVAVLRGDTLLFVSSLVTEADPGLLERTVAALLEAPETTLA